MEGALQFAYDNGLAGGVLALAFYFLRYAYPAWRKIEHDHQVKLAKMAEDARKDFVSELKDTRAAQAEITRLLFQMATK